MEVMKRAAIYVLDYINTLGWGVMFVYIFVHFTP